MFFTVNSPCGKTTTVSPALTGHHIACSGCGVALLVPSPSASAAAAKLRRVRPKFGFELSAGEINLLVFGVVALVIAQPPKDAK